MGGKFLKLAFRRVPVSIAIALLLFAVVNTIALLAASRFGGAWTWLGPVILLVAIVLVLLGILPFPERKPREEPARVLVAPEPMRALVPRGPIEAEPPAVTRRVIYATTRARVVEERTQRPDRVDVTVSVEAAGREIPITDIETSVDDLRVTVARSPTEREMSLALDRWGTFAGRS